MKNEKIKIVAIGGGTGLSVLLQGIKKYPFEISAIVTMTDDGLSTGRLRRDYGILPPGDIRKCIIALSPEENLIAKVFSFRFKRGKGLSGHSLGNLLILALEKITGSFKEALAKASEILAIGGKVIPATYDNIDLMAELKSGKKVMGERKAYLFGKKDPIQRVWITKPNVKGNIDALKAIKNADVIVIGPGSLWTSIIPNLLIKDITKTITGNMKAKKIFICNISTERGETQGYSVENHIEKIFDHSDKKLFNFSLVNSRLIKRSKKEYKLGEIMNISSEKKKFGNVRIIKDNIIDAENPLYHDSIKLAKSIWRFANER